MRTYPSSSDCSSKRWLLNIPNAVKLQLSQHVLPNAWMDPSCSDKRFPNIIKPPVLCARAHSIRAVRVQPHDFGSTRRTRASRRKATAPSQVYLMCNDGASRSACASGLQSQSQGLSGDEALITLFNASSRPCRTRAQRGLGRLLTIVSQAQVWTITSPSRAPKSRRTLSDTRSRGPRRCREEALVQPRIGRCRKSCASTRTCTKPCCSFCRRARPCPC